MLNEIDLSRADLNLLVLFEAVLEERHVGRAADAAEPDAFGGQPWPRPAAPAAQRSAVPEDAQGRRADGARDGTGRADRGRSGAGEERHCDRRAVRSRQIHAPVHDRRAGRRLGRVPATASRRAAAGARPASTSACVSCFPTPGETSPERAWRSAFAELEARAMDIAIIPSDDIPARFHHAHPLRRGFRRRDARRTSVCGRSDPGALLRDAASGGLAHRRSRMASSTRFSRSKAIRGGSR